METHPEKTTQIYPHVRDGNTDQLSSWISRHWIAIFSVIMGVYVGLPFLAPVFMQLGLAGAGKAIYFIYGFLCHQLPQRSFFLFGPKIMYSLSEIQPAVQNTTDPLILRQFIGNPEMGWKVAWSDRMVFMYASTLMFGLIWGSIRQVRISKPKSRLLLRIPWWGLLLFLLPMALDGATHIFSDLAGLGQGFRYTNAWLADLTNNAFPSAFYVGNALGSFNSWMRLISGVFFGFGVVWFVFPFIDRWYGAATSTISAGKIREGNGAW